MHAELLGDMHGARPCMRSPVGNGQALVQGMSSMGAVGHARLTSLLLSREPRARALVLRMRSCAARRLLRRVRRLDHDLGTIADSSISKCMPSEAKLKHAMTQSQISSDATLPRPSASSPS